jgi:hypothetical protein
VYSAFWETHFNADLPKAQAPGNFETNESLGLVYTRHPAEVVKIQKAQFLNPAVQFVEVGLGELQIFLCHD